MTYFERLSSNQQSSGQHLMALNQGLKGRLHLPGIIMRAGPLTPKHTSMYVSKCFPGNWRLQNAFRNDLISGLSDSPDSNHVPANIFYSAVTFVFSSVSFDTTIRPSRVWWRIVGARQFSKLESIPAPYKKHRHTMILIWHREYVLSLAFVLQV